jgi:hypothetical protein
LKFLDFGSKCPTGELLAAFIQKNAVTSLREFQHSRMKVRSSFDKVDFHLCARAQTTDIFINPPPGKVQSGFAGGDDFPVQRTMGLKSAAW